MKRKHVLAGVLAAAMTVLSACSSMPGMGNAQPAADAGSGSGDGQVYELKISTSQTEQSLITRNYQKLADELNENLGVSPVQRQAMEIGSLAGWDVPGADPKAYEQDALQMGGM